jgi:hypothetical protein
MSNLRKTVSEIDGIIHFRKIVTETPFHEVCNNLSSRQSTKTKQNAYTFVVEIRQESSNMLDTFFKESYDNLRGSTGNQDH